MPNTRYLYTLLYRPPGFFSLPPNLAWELIERPWTVSTTNFDRRTDLPVSKFTHGVFAFPRELTAAEISSFELRPLQESDLAC